MKKQRLDWIELPLSIFIEKISKSLEKSEGKEAKSE
jgi:hypothetical protein